MKFLLLVNMSLEFIYLFNFGSPTKNTQKRICKQKNSVHLSCDPSITGDYSIHILDI